MIMKLNLISEGKAKSLYETPDTSELLMVYRDDTSAFDGKKKEALKGKGEINNKFNAFIMEHLANNGVETHFLKLVDKNESLVKRLDMLPVECVVRNIATGSLCRRLGVEEGIKFEEPLFEFFLKDDDLGDPLINDNHITAFGWGTEKEIVEMKEITFKINHLLCTLFKEVGLILVDYKVEYGRFGNALILGDEFTPDGCRIWDAETGESLDKDRFRKDLGDVVESYQIVAHKLGITL
ncbi:MAG: phosphoribosylaminoimidazolesuccinocarboxamide synthase [Candidatus Marinimicrobia bacterium]|nr:phosphoribosylaminoimidazolesuccinocarboxamide synthase [Candidatus Neomarinimicrobiota bacterium]|tara:strand:+ start:1083 stop:1796 length:714 start_codon:yes stop_codon:yes gene_type:complete